MLMWLTCCSSNASARSSLGTEWSSIQFSQWDCPQHSVLASWDRLCSAPMLAARGFGPRSSAGDTQGRAWGAFLGCESHPGGNKSFMGLVLQAGKKKPTARTETWGCAGVSFLETKATVISCHPA